MKIQKIVLKEAVTHEVDGEFEKVYINEKAFPAFLTNAALKKGKDLGLIESSLFSELLKMKDLEKLVDGDKIDPAALDSFDESKMIQIIYLAYLGANKKDPIDLDEFMELYHYQMMETIELYIKLISDQLMEGGNKFALGLKESTAGGSKKK